MINLQQVKNESTIIDLVSSMVSSSSMDENVIGTYLFAYFDDILCYEVIDFVRNRKQTTMKHGYIEEARISWIQMPELFLEKETELASGTILYDKEGKLFQLQQQFQSSYEIGSNQIQFGERFLSDLSLHCKAKSHVPTTEEQKEFKRFLQISYYYEILLNHENKIENLAREIESRKKTSSLDSIYLSALAYADYQRKHFMNETNSMKILLPEETTFPK